MFKITCWVLKYQDSKGYLRVRRFGSYKQAMKWLVKEGMVLRSITAEREVSQ